MQTAFTPPKVLVVTKRLKSMCATKALLNGYGFDVATVTNEGAAQAAARAVHFDACIVCFHSFTPRERDQIAATLRQAHDDTSVVLNCPGCQDCDQAAGRIGHLADTAWLSEILSHA